MINLKKIKKAPVNAEKKICSGDPAMAIIFESDITPLQALMKAEELEKILKGWHELFASARKKMTREKFEQIRALSRMIKNVFDVSPDALDPIPVNLSKITSYQVREYVDGQFDHWQKEAEEDLRNDPAVELIMNRESIGVFVAAFAEVTHRPPLVAYIRNVVGKMTSMEDAAAARNILSQGMSNMLLYGALDRKAVEMPDAFAGLMESHNAGDWNLEAHQMMIFKPFEKRLEALIYNYCKIDRDAGCGA